MPDRKQRAERREQQALEIERNQAALRASIAETERLVGESETMLARHRQERDADDADQTGEAEPAPLPPLSA